MPGQVSTARFGLNVSGAFQRFTATTTAPAGATIDVASQDRGVPAGGALRIDVTISGGDLADGQYFGGITLHSASGTTDVFIPVAWNKTQAGGTSSPRPVPPTIDSIDHGGPPFGYVPLSRSFTLLAGVGDDSITNVAVRSFAYGGETYDTVGIVSDGYVVIGGGDASDVSYVPQDLPDVSPPNNVVAPFWTDLNPDVGGHMYAGELTDGTDSWAVFEWSHVRFYGAGATVSFQIWIHEGPTESVTFVYGSDVPRYGDGGSGLEIGAENRDGRARPSFPRSRRQGQAGASPPLRPPRDDDRRPRERRRADSRPPALVASVRCLG